MFHSIQAVCNMITVVHTILVSSAWNLAVPGFFIDSIQFPSEFLDELISSATCKQITCCFYYVCTGLEFDGGTAAICRRADWPQCLVNETVVFGQIGRALFHLQVTSN